MSSFRALVWATLVLFVGAVAPAAPPVAAACERCAALSLSATEQVVWEQIGAARAEAGLPPLAFDAATMTLARDRSADMARNHYFGHTSATGTTFLDMMPAYGLMGQNAGETIQRNNYANPATEAVRGLLASPAHHAILFDARYRIGGVGSAVGDDGISYFTVIVVQP